MNKPENVKKLIEACMRIGVGRQGDGKYDVEDCLGQSLLSLLNDPGFAVKCKVYLQ